MTNDKRLDAFKRLLDILDELREKCPWDKKQTIESLRKQTIEETFELADAIDEGNYEHLKEELGDLFLHLTFYSKIAQEKNEFDVSDVLNGICEKLVRRHPHIYGDVTVKDEEEVKQNWEKLKLKDGRKSVLEGVPRSMPAMSKAQTIQNKVKSVGFDWENKNQVWEKVLEEIDEFKAVENTNPIEAEKEFGDILFSLINYARFKNIDPEAALDKTNRKFMKRFVYLEKKVQKEGKSIADLTLSEMDVYWEKSKRFD